MIRGDVCLCETEPESTNAVVVALIRPFRFRQVLELIGPGHASAVDSRTAEISRHLEL